LNCKYESGNDEKPLPLTSFSSTFQFEMYLNKFYIFLQIGSSQKEF